MDQSLDELNILISSALEENRNNMEAALTKGRRIAEIQPLDYDSLFFIYAFTRSNRAALEAMIAKSLQRIPEEYRDAVPENHLDREMPKPPPPVLHHHCGGVSILQ